MRGREREGTGGFWQELLCITFLWRVASFPDRIPLASAWVMTRFSPKHTWWGGFETHKRTEQHMPWHFRELMKGRKWMDTLQVMPFVLNVFVSRKQANQGHSCESEIFQVRWALRNTMWAAGAHLQLSVWRVTLDHGLLDNVTHRACDVSRPWPCAQKEIPLTQGLWLSEDQTRPQRPVLANASTQLKPT